MKHFYCPACGGVDTKPHACQTPGCPRKGQPLIEHDGDDMEFHKQNPEAPEMQGDKDLPSGQNLSD